MLCFSPPLPEHHRGQRSIFEQTLFLKNALKNGFLKRKRHVLCFLCFWRVASDDVFGYGAAGVHDRGHDIGSPSRAPLPGSLGRVWFARALYGLTSCQGVVLYRVLLRHALPPPRNLETCEREKCKKKKAKSPF